MSACVSGPRASTTTTSILNLLGTATLCVALLAIAAGAPVGPPFRAAARAASQLWSAVADRNRFRLAPAPLPLARDSALFDEAYREEMFWGTYRPGFYCGARPSNTQR